MNTTRRHAGKTLTALVLAIAGLPALAQETIKVTIRDAVSDGTYELPEGGTIKVTSPQNFQPEKAAAELDDATLALISFTTLPTSVVPPALRAHPLAKRSIVSEIAKKMLPAPVYNSLREAGTRAVTIK